jgi:ubiquinone/menaquinone biosynthesis C-methylase UbiE
MRLTVVFAAAALACTAQVAQHANERYQTREGRDGIAATLTAEGRERTQQPRELLASLGFRPGMTVADVGTGPGYMLPYLSEAVGPSGRVIAEDIFPDFLDRARRTSSEHKLENVTFVQGDERDARLPEAAVDAVLVLDVYHHFNYPVDMLASIRRALKPDGRLIIVEYEKSDKAMGGRGLEHIRLGANDAIREIEKNGFALASRREHAPAVQWVAVFTPVRGKVLEK